MTDKIMSAKADFSGMTSLELGKVAHFLRYGSENPRDDLAPLLTVRCVATLLRIPLRRCYHALDRHQRQSNQASQIQTQSNQAGCRKRDNSITLTDEQIVELTSQDALERAAEQSLETRVSFFNRAHRELKLTRYHLRMLYKRHGIRKKAVVRRLVSAQSQAKQDEERLRFFREYRQVIERKDELVMIDECVFSSKGYQKSVWTLPGQNVILSKRFKNTSCVAVVAAISDRRGLIAYHTKRKSIKQDDFCYFLEWLYKRMNTKNFTMLLDQASIHKGRETREMLTGRKVLYNIPYSPWYNGIELYWAQCKQHFRGNLLRQMLDRTAIDMERLVDQALGSVPEANVMSCAQNALKLIDKDFKNTV